MKIKAPSLNNTPSKLQRTPGQITSQIFGTKL